MVKKIFLISGKAESGKDSFYNIAIGMLPRNASYARLSFGDEVKNVAYTAFNWDGKKNEKGRRLLQWLGDGAREYNKDIWIDKTMERFGILRHGLESYVFVTDCRYPNEIKKAKECGERWGYEVITVRVNRPNHISKLTPSQLLNTSEVALDNADFDYVVENDGTLKDYEDKIRSILYC